MKLIDKIKDKVDEGAEISAAVILDTVEQVRKEGLGKGLEQGAARASGVASEVLNRTRPGGEDYRLFITALPQSDTYRVRDNLDQETYTFLREDDPDGSFCLGVYSALEGKIASLRKVTEKKGLFGKRKTTGIAIQRWGYQDRYLFIRNEKKERVFTTSFNDWITIGDTRNNDYRIFDKGSGRTLAVVEQKRKSAPLVLRCDYGEEADLLILAVAVDVISKEK